MKNKITADNPLWLNTLINDNRKQALRIEELEMELGNLLNKLRSDESLIVFRGSELHLNEHKLNLTELP